MRKLAAQLRVGINEWKGEINLPNRAFFTAGSNIATSLPGLLEDDTAVKSREITTAFKSVFFFLVSLRLSAWYDLENIRIKAREQSMAIGTK